MTEVVVELIDPSTQETRRPELVGVDTEQLDSETQNIVFG